MMSSLYAFAFILLDTTVKITVLLAITTIAVRTARRASASVRHILWTLGLACSLFLPLFSISLPHWNAYLPAASQWQSGPRQTAALGTVPLMPAATFSSQPHVVGASVSPPTPKFHPRAPYAGAVPVPDSHSVSRLIASWPLALLLIWIMGVTVVIVRLLQDLAAVRQIERDSQEVVSGLLKDTVARAMAVIPARRKIQVHVAGETESVNVPITWGAWHPTIVLPAAAASWPRERLYAALLHELAHIHRWDWPLHIMAHTVCTIYWFHPMVWLAARSMRQESETACDDLVVLAGMPAPNYARHLLDVAVAARNQRRIGVGAAAMAQTPKVEGRLRALLAKDLARRPATPRTIIGALLTTLVCALPLASLRLVARSEASTSSAHTADGIKYLPGGGKVQLVGIAYGLPAKGSWWNAAGKLVPSLDSFTASKMSISPQKGWKTRQFVFHPVAEAAGTNYLLASPASNATNTWIGPAANGEKYIKYSASFRNDLLSTTIRLGIARKAWATISSELPASGGMSSAATGKTDQTIAFSPPSMINGKVTFTVSDNVTDCATRIVAVDMNGKIIEADIVSDGQSGTIHQRTISFVVPNKNNLKELRFQTRSYEWLEFTNVPLQPSPNTKG